MNASARAARRNLRDRFRTDAQLAWQEELDAADAILKRNGIRLDMDSPWHPPVSRIKLAQMLTDQ